MYSLEQPMTTAKISLHCILNVKTQYYLKYINNLFKN